MGWAQGSGDTERNLDYRPVRAIAGGRLRQLANNLKRDDYGVRRPQEPIQKRSSVSEVSPGKSEWEAWLEHIRVVGWQPQGPGGGLG